MSEQVEAARNKPEVDLEDLEHEFVPFVRLGDEIQERKVMGDYIEGWKEPLSEEKRLNIIKLTLEEETYNRWHSELYKEHFPEGQMVLRANIEGKWEPLMSVRSLIWMIPYRDMIKTKELEVTESGEFPEEQMSEIRIDKCPDCYPQTWYDASNNGHGFPAIQMMDNLEIKNYDRTDYEKALSQKTKKEENEKHNLILINYALTANRNLPYKIRGAMKAVVKERGELAGKLGLGCDTYTPANGLARYLKKLQIFDEEFERRKVFFVKKYINENILNVAASGVYSDIKDAATLHLIQGANFVGYALDAREDPRTKKVCIITCYVE
jgi:hypothetical protein